MQRCLALLRGIVLQWVDDESAVGALNQLLHIAKNGTLNETAPVMRMLCSAVVHSMAPRSVLVMRTILLGVEAGGWDDSLQNKLFFQLERWLQTQSPIDHGAPIFHAFRAQHSHCGIEGFVENDWYRA